ncbi:Hypothetical protein CINCED_3A015807 [Cinara cedri]|uniref:Uncharacterized protein n=1 Tax=Cinara cedri TaxID=506608 RepID=A0A5E4NMJ3_9HEMI|nr:Hypothetical protein CINCED_3A015807 [Cinara cedri]
MNYHVERRAVVQIFHWIQARWRSTGTCPTNENLYMLSVLVSSVTKRLVPSKKSGEENSLPGFFRNPPIADQELNPRRLPKTNQEINPSRFFDCGFADSTSAVVEKSCNFVRLNR